jgi:hypothetical protein
VDFALTDDQATIRKAVGELGHDVGNGRKVWISKA